MSEPTILTYGTGNLWTQQGVIHGDRCITIRELDKPMPVGSVPREWEPQSSASEFKCLLVFKTIESARTLQDELNELISKWSKEVAQVVDYKPDATPNSRENKAE